VGVSDETALVNRRHDATSLHGIDHLEDLGVLEVETIDQHPVKTRSPAGDGRPVHDATRAYHPASFAQSGEPVFSVLQVVKGAEEKDDVDRVISQVEAAGVAHRGIDASAVTTPYLIHVAGDDVAMDHLVAGLDQPVGVPARTASDVSDHRPRRRKGPFDDLDRAKELDESHSP
jgi:hypothetical protein